MAENSNKPPEQQKPLRLRINHPKINQMTFSLSKQTQISQAIKTLTQDNLLKLFNNFHFQYQGQPLKTTLTILETFGERESAELDVVFEPYRYSTALYHFQQISRLLKNPQTLYSLLKPSGKDQKISYDVDIQTLTKELVPEILKGTKCPIEEVITPSYRSELWQARRQQGFQLVQYLELSGFNPPPPQAEFAGDLFYLHLKTLENGDCHITASPLGFYQNLSKINSYNPTIVNGKTPSTNLLDLLASISDRFSQAVERNLKFAETSLLQKLGRRHQSLLANLRPHQSRGRWLDNWEQDHQWNIRKQYALRDLQAPSQSLSDWNQQFLLLQKQSQNGEWTGSGFRQVYGPFISAAVEGARKIVEGKLLAINHMDEKRKHIFIHNKIFFSVTQDTPFDHSLQKGQDAIPSASSANIDLNNLETLLHLPRSSLRLLHTVLVNYQGHKIIGQTIIPGLLSSELSYLTQYGSIDEGKTIQANPQFHQLLIPVCKALHLDDKVQALERNQNVVSIAISPQIKGIRSIGGEYYLCDLQKLSPRDLNYEGPNYQACVLRQKLIQQFLEERKSETESINVNIGTEVRFKMSEKTDKQQNLLLSMAQYLKDKAIIRLIEALKSKNAGDYLTDSKGLSAIFHEYGVNMRYLGYVQSHELLKDCIEVKYCLIRIIFVRCLKHLFKNALRTTNCLHLSAVISHLLNCIFAKRQAVALLNEVEQGEDRHEVLQPKKKKKKKNKEEQKDSKQLLTEEHKAIKAQKPQYLSMKPNDIWQQIKKLGKARFEFDFQHSQQEFQQKGLFNLPYQKYATLRDLCLNIGLVLQKKDYPLRETDKQQGQPFNPRNILYFTPIPKMVTIRPSQNLSNRIKQADNHFNTGNYYEAQRIYDELIETMRQKKEGEHQLSHCLGQISRIFYLNGKIKEAIAIESENLIFSQRAGREDSLQVMRCYSRLGLYCMSLSSWDLALWLLNKGLHLMLVSFGEAYPDVLINFANIARVHQLTKQVSLANSCYLRAIELLSQVYGGKSHVNISFCYSSLASLHYDQGDYRRSVEYQTEAVNIINKVLAPEDSRLLDAVKILKVYKQIQASTKNSKQESHTQNRKK